MSIVSKNPEACLIEAMIFFYAEIIFKNDREQEIKNEKEDSKAELETQLEENYQAASRS